jgi:hypothetical protein
MAQGETIWGLSSIDIALGSAVFSFVSICIAARLAWVTKFSPPKLVGTFPHIIVWTFFDQRDQKPNGQFLVPFFWLSNIGARPMLVEDLRITFRPKDTESFLLYPTHSVPAEAIESPNIFSEYGLLHAGMAPFCGFAVPTSETWKCYYAFAISPKQRKPLIGLVQITVEVKRLGTRHFRRVLHDTFVFNQPSFSWERWAGVGGPSAEYYYSSGLHERKSR